MGRSVKTRKRKQLRISTQKSKLCVNNQHVLDCDHAIDWENVKISKSEPYVKRRRMLESFLINQTTKECSVLNLNNGAILPGVYKLLLICWLLIYMHNSMRFLYLRFCRISLKMQSF